MPRQRGAANAKRSLRPASSRQRGHATGVIGLDIGTSAVRAIEVCTDSGHAHTAFGQPGGERQRAAVRLFGQVPLPPGAAADGEVLDPLLVGQAIAALWQQLGLRRHDVRIGLASQRLVVRTIELPEMPAAELEAAVRFSAQDHISIPLDEAVLDFTVLEKIIAADGTPMVRLLLAAAHRDALAGLMQAAAAGGVRVVGVDLVPFALVRVLVGDPQPDTEADVVAALPEAIVSVGAGVTTVVVHEGGRPRFVRTIATGGRALTSGLADELGLEPADAEAVKLADPTADPDLVARAARILQARIGGIVGEVQGSLNYWMAQSDLSLARVLVTGGSAEAGDLPGRLSLMLGVPVELVRAADHLDFEADGSESALVAAGLALGAVPPPGRNGLTARRIDLCPEKPKDRGDGRERRILVGAGVAVLVMLAGLTANSFLSVSRERSSLTRQQQANGALEAELTKFVDVRQTRAALEAGRLRVNAALAGDIAWARLLEQIAHRLPDGVWLSSLEAQRDTAALPVAVAPTPGAAPTGAAPPGIAPSGSLSFTASASDFPTVASWIDALSQEPAASGLTVSGLSRTEMNGGSLVNFASTAKITPAAGSTRAGDLADDLGDGHGHETPMSGNTAQVTP